MFGGTQGSLRGTRASDGRMPRCTGRRKALALFLKKKIPVSEHLATKPEPLPAPQSHVTPHMRALCDLIKQTGQTRWTERLGELAHVTCLRVANSVALRVELDRLKTFGSCVLGLLLGGHDGRSQDHVSFKKIERLTLPAVKLLLLMWLRKLKKKIFLTKGKTEATSHSVLSSGFPADFLLPYRSLKSG